MSNPDIGTTYDYYIHIYEDPILAKFCRHLYIGMYLFNLAKVGSSMNETLVEISLQYSRAIKGNKGDPHVSASYTNHFAQEDPTSHLSST